MSVRSGVTSRSRSRACGRVSTSHSTTPSILEYLLGTKPMQLGQADCHWRSTSPIQDWSARGNENLLSGRAN
ncbi:hypothetical protein RSAG8_10242, partial [Rhizoctonia solani AG-8 WAC10335]